jgi:hypothetical protein
MPGGNVDLDPVRDTTVILNFFESMRAVRTGAPKFPEA